MSKRKPPRQRGRKTISATLQGCAYTNEITEVSRLFESFQRLPLEIMTKLLTKGDMGMDIARVGSDANIKIALTPSRRMSEAIMAWQTAESILVRTLAQLGKTENENE